MAQPQQLLGINAHEQRVAEAAEALRRLAGDCPRPLAIISGSGLVGLVSALSVERRIAATEIPPLPTPTVVGHSGGIFLGHIGPLGTIFFGGRVHLYEGRSPLESVFAVHLAARLGATTLLVTNATGGIKPHFRAGDLVLLRDQINLTFRPLRMKRGGWGTPSGPLYDPGLSETMRQAARDEKINLKEGIYGGTLGPTYETKAESALWDEIGADIIGMSTIAELLAARAVGLRAVGLSCVANTVPRWGRTQAVTHDDVLARVSGAVERMKRLLVRWANLMGGEANASR